MSKKPPTWRCADGRVLKLKDMEIDHLINTFHYLKRRAREEHVKYINNCVHNDINVPSVDKFCLSVWPIYGEFRKEIANRLRAMPQGSIQRKYWHMKFSNDTKKVVTKSDNWMTSEDEFNEFERNDPRWGDA